MIWWPTLIGWLLVVAIFLLPVVLWFAKGEDFLAATQREPADILVVEAWIGYEGLHAAATEYFTHSYKYVIVTGGLTSERWSTQRWLYTDMARKEFVRAGVPAENIIVAPSKDTETQRTYACAVAVQDVLGSGHYRFGAMNLFTKGVHARRSRLIFERVLGSDHKLGIISWMPAKELNGPWWNSSERAQEFLKETVGWGFELLLNSGRASNR